MSASARASPWAFLSRSATAPGQAPVGRSNALVLAVAQGLFTAAVSIDLTLTGRPRLVADLAFALRHHLADKSRHTRQNVRKHLRRFLAFLDQHDPACTQILSAQDVDGGTLRAYVAWLDSLPLTKGSRAAVWMTLKVALAWFKRHRPDLVQPELELLFNPFPRHHKEQHPRPALAREEIEAVLAACRRDVEASWSDFQRGREPISASARMALIGEPTIRDLSDLGVLLSVLAQRHGGLLPGDSDTNWPMC